MLAVLQKPNYFGYIDNVNLLVQVFLIVGKFVYAGGTETAWYKDCVKITNEKTSESCT